MTTSTRAISKTLLDKETDARFWAQTGYKVGSKLDPTDPADRKMAKVWVDIYAKVKREDDAGRLVVTYNHPRVEQALDDAAAASSVSDAHLDAAVQSADPARTQQHVEAAAQASDVAAGHARRAAQYQPPTVSPIVVQAAAQEAAHEVSAPPPPLVVQSLPPHHPAVRSVSAQPILTPEIVQAATQPRPGAPGASDPMPVEVLSTNGGAPTTLDHATIVDPGVAHGYLTSAPPPARHQAREHHRRHQFSAARAAQAPAVAVEVHADARARDDAGAPPPTSTVHPQTVADIRAVAGELAQRAGAPVVGVSYSAGDQWAVLQFQTADEAAGWYDQTHDHLDAFKYLAYFDKSSPAWPGSVNEVLGASKVAEVHESAPAQIVTVVKNHYGVTAAIAGVAGAATLLLLSKHKRRAL